MKGGLNASIPIAISRFQHSGMELGKKRLHKLFLPFMFFMFFMSFMVRQIG